METRTQQRELVSALFKSASAAGFTLLYIDDGGDEMESCTTESAAVETVFSVQDCTVYFLKSRKRHWLRVISGNDGPEIFCDCSDDGGPDTMNPLPGTFAAMVESVTK